MINGMIEKILDGHSVRTYMSPAIGFGTNLKEYFETFDLPYVIIPKSGYFWAKSQTGHCDTTHRDAPSTFCYDSENLLFNYLPSKQFGTLMNKVVYKVFEWRLQKEFQVVWDSQTHKPTDIAPILKENERGAKFKAAFLDRENVWNVIPCEFVFHYPATNDIVAITLWDFYPVILRKPDEFKSYLLTNCADHFDMRADLKFSDPKSNFTIDTENHHTAYRLALDGTYEDHNTGPATYSSPTTTGRFYHRYKRLKLFSSII